MSHKIVLPSLFLCIAVAVQALSLKEAVVETLETNPKVIEYMENYQVSKEDLDISNSGYLPTIDLKAGYGYQDVSNSNTHFEKRSDDIYETSLIFNQNLFDGFSTTYSVSTSEARLMAASYRYIEQANETAFETLKAYLDVLKEKEIQSIAIQNIQINNKIFNKVQALYDTGMTTLSEKEKIESSLSLARSNYFVSKNNYRDAKRAFEKLLGRYVDAELMSVPEFEVRLPLKREEALNFSIDNNPSIRISDYELMAAQEDYLEKKSLYYPSIDAEVRQAFNNNLNGIHGEEDDFKAMLVLTYNIYNGGADSADIQKRRNIISREMAVRDDIKRQIKEDFAFSWTAIEELQNQSKHLNAYKKHSVKTLMLYTDEYEMGRRSLLDLLASQNDLISAKKQIVNAKYNLLFKKYYLLNTMSIMVPSVVGQLDGLYKDVGLKKADNSEMQMGVEFSNNYIEKHQKICEQTLSQTVSKLYGCETENTQTQRFSEFVYECKAQKLEPSSLKRLNSVIEDLKSSDMNGKEITIISHADASGNAEEDMILTQKQNLWLKNYMQEKGINAQQIKMLAKGSTEPLWLDKIAGLSEQNCRTDIVVTVRAEDSNQSK